MKQNTNTPAATIDGASVCYPLDAFEAGLKSQVPTELIPGLIVHHKDLVISDKTKAHLDEDKLSKPGPINPAGTMTLLTPESFAMAIMDYRDNRTRVFADSEGSAITAVFDAIQPGDGFYDRKAGWGQLRAVIGFAESRKLKEWRKTLEWMSQIDFANFIEDHTEDILAFPAETDTTVEVPRNLTLGIPLFEHGDRYKLGARLRFVVSGGTVKFRLLFTNLQDAKEQEFERIVQDIEAKTSQPIYRGRLTLPW